MDDNKALMDRAKEIMAALGCMEREVDCTDCHYYNGITCEPKRLDADAVALLEARAAQLAAVTAERDALGDALRDMVGQYCSYDGKLDHEFMSAGEHAFDVLDLDYGAPIETLWRGAQGEGQDTKSAPSAAQDTTTL